MKAFVCRVWAVPGGLFTRRSKQPPARQSPGKRDLDAFAKLVAACGNNRALAEKLIEYEYQLNGWSCRYHAILAATGRIRDYRRYGRLLGPQPDAC